MNGPQPPCASPHRNYPISMPPFTFSTWPVIYDASSDAKNATAPASSSGVPTRPNGICFTAFCLKSSLKTAVMAVSMKPGATALQVMLRELTSRAMAMVSPISPALRKRHSFACPKSLAHLTENTGDVDDASPALFEHGADDLLNAEIGGGQVRLQNGIPVGTLHSHHELIAGDAGVVDQDVDLPELRNRRLHHGLDLLFLAYVECQRGSVAARRGNFVNQFIQPFLVACGNGDPVAPSLASLTAHVASDAL